MSPSFGTKLLINGFQSQVVLDGAFSDKYIGPSSMLKSLICVFYKHSSSEIFL